MNVPVRYRVSAALLCRAARMLQPPERCCFVSGIDLSSNEIVLTDLFLVPETASRVDVIPSPVGVFRLEEYLDRLGLKIQAQFHSHPGTHSHSTYPSVVDLATARRWEVDGTPFLSGIFSEGGRFVRFYTFEQQTEVRIDGTHKKLSTGCFELPTDAEPYVQGRTDYPWGLFHNGSPGTTPVVEPETNQKVQGPDGWLWRFGQLFGADASPNGRGGIGDD